MTAPPDRAETRRDHTPARGPELAHLRCRYSEGSLYEDGPPDAPCGSGAHPGSPFCGGRCGDTCPPTSIESFDRPACVGISETRAFGVCVPSPRPRCGVSDSSGLEDCEYWAGAPCVCMVLSPIVLPEWADSGWGVRAESCLAYQVQYPGEVRCYDRDGREL